MRDSQTQDAAPLRILSYLVKEGTDRFPLSPQDGSTVMHVASSRGHQACVQLLLECAAAANSMLDDQDKWGNTALHLAVRKRHAQVGWLVGWLGWLAGWVPTIP